MADDTQIRLNPAKPSDLEFDVMIVGVDDVNIPAVRFVILDMSDKCDHSFRCSKVEGEKTKWVAKLPALKVKTNTVKFHVEVIIDEYFFIPADGEITFVSSPEVQFKPKSSPKPSVTTSFTVKQVEEAVIEEVPVVEHAMGN